MVLRKKNKTVKRKYIQLSSIPVIGMLYHVSWSSSKAVVGKCMSIDLDRNEVILRSPKSKIYWKHAVKFNDLLLIRKEQIKQQDNGK